MGTRPKNREWVKNAAIVLLAVLLVLTFFSNTIMNRTLPEVATQYVTDGSITAKVRGTGKVTANGTHQVKAAETREIRAVMIKAGQKVEAGDVLFVLGNGESSELEQAQEQLRQLQISYQRTALGGSSADYTADEYRVQIAREAYESAEAAVAALENMDHSQAVEKLTKDKEKRVQEMGENNGTIDKNLTKIAEDQKALDAAEAERDALKIAYDDLLGARQSDRLVAETNVKKYYEAQNNESADGTGEDSGSADGAGENSGSIDGETTGAEEEKGPRYDQKTLEEKLKAPQDTYNELMYLPDVPEEELEVWRVYAEAFQAVSDALSEKDPLFASTVAEIESAQEKVDGLQTEIEKLKSDNDLLRAKNDVLLSEISEIEAQINDHKSGDPNAAAYKQAVADRDQAYLNYLDMRSSLEQRKQSDAKSNASLGLELTDLATQIEAQKKKIEELSGGEENQITANVSGTVQSVEITAGDMATKDQVLCVIEVPDMGYTLSFTVTNDQAARLKVGDSATVSNYYWGSQIVATLESIRVDPRDPQTSKLLTFEVSGDVNAGTDLTISVGSRSANYDTIVPKSAIHNDSNGDFVFKVEAKSSPLGNRYIARRVSVDILAQDDTSAAITGDIGWGDYVITTSNAPIKNGDMVRLAD